MTKHSKWHFPDEKVARKVKKIMPQITKTTGVMPQRTAGVSEATLQNRKMYDSLVNDLSETEMTVITPEGDEKTRAIAVNVSRAATRQGKSERINMVTFDGKVHVRLFTDAELTASRQRAATRAANLEKKAAEKAAKTPGPVNSRQPQPVGA